jgi:hypothetical protein
MAQRHMPFFARMSFGFSDPRDVQVPCREPERDTHQFVAQDSNDRDNTFGAMLHALSAFAQQNPDGRHPAHCTVESWASRR